MEGKRPKKNGRASRDNAAVRKRPHLWGQIQAVLGTRTWSIACPLETKTCSIRLLEPWTKRAAEDETANPAVTSAAVQLSSKPWAPIR